MNDPLQPFDFKSSQYERPNHGWECGKLCDGTPCAFGPTAKGSCQGASPCTPEKEGDRYLCKRPAIHGGACQDGPLPNGTCCQPDETCQPVRNLLGRRKRLTLWVTGLALAVCFLIFGTDKTELFGTNHPYAWMSPGSLNTQHSTFESDCSKCHHAAQLGHDWTENLFAQGDGLTDSKLCLDCHDEIRSDSFHPHTLAETDLKQLTSEALAGKQEQRTPVLLELAKQTTDMAHFEAGSIACSVCHHEHHGNDFDLRELTDRQCQVCHTSQFASFETGHPQFDTYPYARRTRIAFDHQRHFGDYFRNENYKRIMPGWMPREQDCNACHELSSTTGTFLTKSFEASCADCHESEIIDEGYPGIAFLTLPIVTQAQLQAKPAAAADAAADNTPAAAPPDFSWWPVTDTANWRAAQSERSSVLLRLLLLSDADSAKLVNELDQAGGKIDAELIETNPALIRNYVTAIRDLLQTIAAEGPQKLQQRLNNVFGHSPGNPPQAHRFGPAETRQLYHALAAANQLWFEDSSVIDPGFLSAPPTPPEPPQVPEEKPKDNPDDKPADATTDKPDKDREVTKAADVPESAKLLKERADYNEAFQKYKAELAAYNTQKTEYESKLKSYLEAQQKRIAAAAKLLSAAGLTGWSVNSKTHAIEYRPSSHSDSFLTFWLDRLAQSPHLFEEDSHGGTLWRLLVQPSGTGTQEVNPSANGRCFTCHSIDRSGESLSIQWKSKGWLGAQKPFTRFSHTPHLKVMDDQQCSQCHQLDLVPATFPHFTETYATIDAEHWIARPVTDPHHAFSSGFQPIDKSSCVKCHNSRTVHDSCLDCHNYHVRRHRE